MIKLMWTNKFLILNYIKILIPENLYKLKFLKSFIIVSMLRNYVTESKSNIENNSIIINKYLITKPTDTKNLEITFIKIFVQENYTEIYDCIVFKIVLHINNSFNPTKINLFDNKNQFHLHQLPGDSTLHINMGIISFFRVLSKGSNLTNFVTELIKTQLITSYKEDQSGNMILDF